MASFEPDAHDEGSPRLNLSELARMLDMSPSTISRALNRPEMVAEATRDKVLRAVKAYGYQPNGIARSLRKGRTQLIGIVVSDIQNPFYSTIVKAVERVAAGHGYSTVICNADEDAENEVTALNLLSEMQVSGIIHGSTGANVRTLRKLRDAGIPIVDLDRLSGLEHTDAVLVDNIEGARAAAAYLLELGHRRLAIVTGPLRLTTGLDRLKGFEQAILAAGEQLPDEYVEVGDFRSGSGHEATRRLLALPEPPTALFIANNEMLTGALNALREAQVRVPEALSLISFDDAPWAQHLSPALTVVAQPTERLGVTAADLLFERLAGRTEPARMVLEPKLVVRASCAAV